MMKNDEKQRIILEIRELEEKVRKLSERIDRTKNDIRYMEDTFTQIAEKANLEDYITKWRIPKEYSISRKIEILKYESY